MLQLVLYLIAFVVGILDIMFNPAGHNLQAICSTLLLYQLVITIGLTGVLGFLCHLLFGEKTASILEWTPSSPFQAILGFAELGFGIAGIMSFWYHGDFWLAVIVYAVVFHIGIACVHVNEVIKLKRFKTRNIYYLVPCLLIPATLIALWAMVS